MIKHLLLYIDWTTMLWKDGIILWIWRNLDCLYHEVVGGRGRGGERDGGRGEGEEQKEKEV